jgi:hypothetical protein
LGGDRLRCEHPAVNADDTAVATPRPDRRLLLARAIAAVTASGIVAAIWLGVLESRLTGGTPLSSNLLSDLGFVAVFATFPVIGYVLATRRPENSLGWLLMGIGAVFGVSAFADSFTSYAIHTGSSPRLGALVAAINGPMWLPIVVLPATFLLLLFPDGHLPSRRWRWFARVLAVGFVLICLLIMLSPGRMTDSGYPQVVNPIGVEALRPILSVALGLLAVIPIGVVGSLASLVMRFRRSSSAGS